MTQQVVALDPSSIIIPSSHPATPRLFPYASVHDFAGSCRCHLPSRHPATSLLPKTSTAYGKSQIPNEIM